MIGLPKPAEKILTLLVEHDGWLTNSECRLLPYPASTVYWTLKKLAQLGLIRSEKEGVYYLTEKGVIALKTFGTKSVRIPEFKSPEFPDSLRAYIRHSEALKVRLTLERHPNVVDYWPKKVIRFHDKHNRSPFDALVFAKGGRYGLVFLRVLKPNRFKELLLKTLSYRTDLNKVLFVIDTFYWTVEVIQGWIKKNSQAPTNWYWICVDIQQDRLNAKCFNPDGVTEPLSKLLV